MENIVDTVRRQRLVVGKWKADNSDGSINERPRACALNAGKKSAIGCCATNARPETAKGRGTKSGGRAALGVLQNDSKSYEELHTGGTQ